MSHSDIPSDAPKPVVKDKNPHNYRKVGYSMIVISSFLVIIGLLVWAIGDNYHFSTDIMAKQEIDSMTPKSNYAVIIFDYSQPIGAKLKFLDFAKDFETATKLKTQYTEEYLSQKGQVLIFDTSIVNNTNSISLAEVYAMTPTIGYNVVSFNTVMPVGARLSGLKTDVSLGDALNDTKKTSDLNADKLTRIVTFTSSLEDNLKQVLGSKYDPKMISENLNNIKSMPQKLIVQKPQPSIMSSGANNTAITSSTHTTTNASSVTIPTNSSSTHTTTNASSVTMPYNSSNMTNSINMTLH
jgi:hypothetical protein